MIKQSARKSIKTYGACLVIGPKQAKPTLCLAQPFRLSIGSGPKSPNKIWQRKCRIHTHTGKEGGIDGSFRMVELLATFWLGRLAAMSWRVMCQPAITPMGYALDYHPKQQYLLNCSFDYKSVWTNLFVLTTDQDLFWLYFDTFFWHVGPTCYACNFVKICHGYNLNTLSSQLWEDTNFGLAINQTIIFVPNLVMLFGYG